MVDGALLIHPTNLNHRAIAPSRIRIRCANKLVVRGFLFIDEYVFIPYLLPAAAEPTKGKVTANGNPARLAGCYQSPVESQSRAGV